MSRQPASILVAFELLFACVTNELCLNAVQCIHPGKEVRLRPSNDVKRRMWVSLQRGKQLLAQSHRFTHFIGAASGQTQRAEIHFARQQRAAVDARA